MDLNSLRKEARQYIKTITASKAAPTSWSKTTLVQEETKASSLTDLVNGFDLAQSSGDKGELFEMILVAELYLAEDEKDETIEQKCSSQDAAVSLRGWVAKAILPTDPFAEASPYSTQERPVIAEDEIARFREMGVKGLGLLSRLQKSFPFSLNESAVTLFTCLSSYSDASDPWTSPKAQSQAHDLLEDHIDAIRLPALITDLLKERVRPLFAKSKIPAITPQARKAVDPRPSDDTAHSDLDAKLKPWKYLDVYIVTVFQWILGQLNEASVEANWPLLIPPLLALIDDSSITYKAKGCDLLALFLQSCPSPLLERTGLGEVFENALMPCLLYLPSLTEEIESLQLLRTAYPALISLADVRFADEKHHVARMEGFDKVIRYGVLKGYTHAGEHVKIAELLMIQMKDLVDKMGVEFAKHLKHMIRLLSASLASPFATAYPPLLQASATAMQAIIVNSWPRAQYHRSEILKGLTMCWCRIEDEQDMSKALRKVQETIEQAVRLLTSVLKRDVVVAAEYQLLIDSEPRLQNLLVV